MNVNLLNLAIAMFASALRDATDPTKYSWGRIAEITLDIFSRQFDDVPEVTGDMIRKRVTRFKERLESDAHFEPANNLEILENFGFVYDDARYYPGERHPISGDIIGLFAQGDFIGYNLSEEEVSFSVEGDFESYVPEVDGEGIDVPVINDDKGPIQFLETGDVLVLIRDGRPLTIEKSHEFFPDIKKNLNAGKWNKALDLIDRKNTVAKLKEFVEGMIRVVPEGVYVGDKLLHGAIGKKLMEQFNDANVLELQRYAKFQDKLQQNPSFKVLNRLYEFVSYGDIQIDADGFIIAYKVVSNKYLDLHTRTFDNSPGKILEVDRNSVDDDMEAECSYGLHVCAVTYLNSFGSAKHGSDRVVRVKLHPADVVAVPPDYESQKIRTCKYEVLSDVTEEVKYKYLR
jgi:hypothetical protein